MGKRGPRPQPTAFKIVRGNPGKRKLPENEPAPEVAAMVPAPPAWLDGQARAEWKRIAPELHKLGLLTDIDVTQLAAYCQAYADVVARKRDLDKIDEPWLYSDNGGAYPHPAVSLYNTALAKMRAFASDFGLSPSSRVGLTVKAAEAPKVRSRSRA